MQIDTSKSLAELSGVDWDPAPAGASLIVQERHSLHRKPLRDLSNADMQRLLDMGAHTDILVPAALERSSADTVPLFCAILRTTEYDWRSHPEDLATLRDQIYHVDNHLWQFEADVESLVSRVEIWKLYAELERSLSDAQPHAPPIREPATGPRQVS